MKTRTQKEKCEIRKLPIVDAQGVDAAGLGVATKSNSAKVEVSAEVSITGTNDKLMVLLKALFQGLDANMYRSEAMDIIEETRVVL